MKSFRTAGMILYSIVALSAVATVIAHLWGVQLDLVQERRLDDAFRHA